VIIGQIHYKNLSKCYQYVVLILTNKKTFKWNDPTEKINFKPLILKNEVPRISFSYLKCIEGYSMTKKTWNILLHY